MESNLFVQHIFNYSNAIPKYYLRRMSYIELILQSNEVGGSYYTELEGLKRTLATVGDQLVRKLITDRHRQIAKWLRENVPNIMHCFDVWHVAKGLFMFHRLPL